MNLSDKAHLLQNENIFLGGPIEQFETAGRKQLMTLLSQGLTPQSTVLDIGCGCLRTGTWLIPLLDKGSYFGIEPNQKMVEAGLRILLDPGVEALKQPRFDHNADFDFSVFGRRFDYFVARSIWSHASRGHIEKMLDEFIENAEIGAVFLTSYYKSAYFRAGYTGQKWIGRSHKSNAAGIVKHSRSWIKKACRRRGLRVRALKEKSLNFGKQEWLAISAGDH